MQVYLASGWFSDAQRAALGEMRQAVAKLGFADVYDPQQDLLCPADASHDFASYVLAENCRQIQAADVVYASLVGRDLGTSWEVGYAMAHGKRIVFHGGLTEDVADILAHDMDYYASHKWYVCDTTDKSPSRVATAGYLYAKGVPIIYFAQLPPNAQFNLMLAKTGVAVATDVTDVRHCIACLTTELGWTRPYRGAIE